MDYAAERHGFPISYRGYVLCGPKHNPPGCGCTRSKQRGKATVGFATAETSDRAIEKADLLLDAKAGKN